jgi:hypothetical protein
MRVPGGHAVGAALSQAKSERPNKKIERKDMEPVPL